VTTTPTLNGRTIGQAERATRAVLDDLLATLDLDFEQWIPINLVALNGAPMATTALVAALQGGLRVPAATAEAMIERLGATGLTERSSDGILVLSPTGTAVHDRVQAGIEGIVERLYADIPADDLATAGRVLSLITDRATAELAR
jgi:hypothetical protein